MTVDHRQQITGN